jgi:hypothetical protein
VWKQEEVKNIDAAETTKRTGKGEEMNGIDMKPETRYRL